MRSLNMKDINRWDEGGFRRYIIGGIEKFTKEVLGDEYIAHREEYQFGDLDAKRDVFSERVDLYIQGQDKEYLIELKAANRRLVSRHAIGQLLAYGLEYGKSKTDLCLVTGKFDKHTADIIIKYSLPIRYICLMEDGVYEFKKHEHTNG